MKKSKQSSRKHISLIQHFKSLINKNKMILFLFVSTLAIYINNLSSSVYGGDSGDLISAAITNGVPHPSGYPTFTMLGIILNHLSINATPAWKVGLASALFSSLSVVLVYKILFLLIKTKYPAIFASATLAFLYPFWLYAEVVEVFALNSFFILLLTYLAIKYGEEKKDKYIYIISFVAGLSATNNQVTFLLFPAILIFILWSKSNLIKNFKLLLKSFLFFIVGLLPYLYIPIAASFHPAINWGNVVDLDNFIAMITRQQYGWGGNPIKAKYTPLLALEPMYYYWKIHITPLIPVLSLAGIVTLISQKKYKLLTFFTLSFLLLGPFFMIFGHRSAVDAILKLAIVEKFITQSAIFAIILAAIGIQGIVQLISNLLKFKPKLASMIKIITICVFLIIPVSEFIVGFEKTNLSNIWTGDYFAQDVLSTPSKEGVLLLSTDHYIFNTLYRQIEYEERKDLEIPGAQVGFETLFNNSQVLSQVNMEEYNKSRRNLVDDNLLILSIAETLKKEDTYIDVGLGLEITDDLYAIAIPYGLLHKLEYENNFTISEREYLDTIDKIWNSYHLDQLSKNNYTISNNLILSDIRGLYILGLKNTAEFIRTYYKDDRTAAIYELKAFQLDPLQLTKQTYK